MRDKLQQLFGNMQVPMCHLTRRSLPNVEGRSRVQSLTLGYSELFPRALCAKASSMTLLRSIPKHCSQGPEGRMQFTMDIIARYRSPTF